MKYIILVLSFLSCNNFNNSNKSNKFVSSNYSLKLLLDAVKEDNLDLLKKLINLGKEKGLYLQKEGDEALELAIKLEKKEKTFN